MEEALSVADVEHAIRHARRVIGEWEDIDLNWWREDQTRYAIIDPIIRALGWNTADPQECCPEYGRGDGRVDYAIFGEGVELVSIGNSEAKPLIVVEAKPVDADLTEVPEQLAYYVDTEPAIDYGAGVVTNGRVWILYFLSRRGELQDKYVATVNVTEGGVGAAAKTLHYWLSKELW